MIRIERDGPALVVTLARLDKKNALSLELLSALRTAIDQASADVDVRAVVLANEGPIFAAGGDLGEIARAMEDADGASRVLEMTDHVDALAACDVPVIAAVAGDIYGGGCELLVACDLSVMERGRTLSFKHARMGLTPAWGGTARLFERAGPLGAARALFTSETIDADRAVALGLVNEVVEHGDAKSRALALASEVALAGRAVISTQKRLLAEVRRDWAKAAKARENAAFTSLFGGPDHRRAMERFRKP